MLSFRKATISWFYVSSTKTPTHKHLARIENVLYSTGGVDGHEQIIESSSKDKIRNISRLPSHLKKHLKHVSEFTHIHHYNRTFQRNLFAKYGEGSGVSPGVMWPTKDELTRMLEDEMLFEPSLEERLEKLNRKITNRELEAQSIDDNVAKQMSKMPQYIDAFRQKLQESEKEMMKQEVHKKEQMEEAKEYFGYDIKPSDPRYVRMQELKQEEKKKEMRKMRKELKNQQMQESLKQMEAEAKQKRQELEALEKNKS